MRIFFAALALAACLLLGAMQAVATLAVRPAAGPGAWVLAVPPALETRVLELAVAPLPLPLPPLLRLMLARSALAAGDVASARDTVALLPPGIERDELEGEVRERGGDLDAAADAYLRAGDVPEVERRVEELEHANAPLQAVALARAAVARVSADRAHGESLADAWWTLGVAEQFAAYVAYPNDPAQKAAAMRGALADYQKAVELGPLVAKFALAAGAQEQNLGDLDAAQTYYARALAIDPASADATASLGELALLRGNRARAAALLARARALDPQSESAARLARKLAP